MMESSHFLEDHQAAYRTLNDQLDKVFEMANGVCRQLTNLDAKVQPADEIIDLYAHYENCDRIMRSLTQLKVYEPVENDEYSGSSSGGGRKRLQLVNQSKFISNLCEMLFMKLNTFTDDYVKHILNLIGDLDSTYNLQRLMLYWKHISSIYRESTIMLTELYEYVRHNFPQVKRNLDTFADITTMLLINFFQSHMGSKFVNLIEVFVNNGRSENHLDTKISGSFLKKLYHHNVLIDKDRDQHFQDFYFEYLSKYVENKVVIPMNIDYMKNLKKQLELNAKLTLSISPTMIEKANDIFLQHTILKAETASQLMEVEKDNIKFYSVKAPERYFPFPKENFSLLKIAFESRGRTMELERVFKKLSRKLLKRAHPDLERLFSEACKLILLVSGYPNFGAISREEITKILGGPLNTMELYVRFCESSIRKVNRDKNLRDHYVGSPSIFQAPILLEINAAVLDLYSRSLFRRAIMQGANSVLKSLKDPDSLEFQLINFFRDIYGTSSEFRNLEATTEIVLKAFYLNSSFEQSSSNKNKFIQPLVFEKKMVPEIYQRGDNEDIVLPPELVESWEEFMKHFNSTDKKPELKKVHPVHHLQHCEVSTPYKLKSGKGLSLELTLYQTCLLSLFNDYEELEFNEIMSKLRMTKSTLDVVLKSFTDVGLLILQGNTKYTLNKNYSPDKRKIKDGKLRIPLLRPISSSGRSDSNGSVVISSQHHEGHSSQWKQELLKACIVRSLKGESNGLNLPELFNKVESQLRGISIGEFKDALDKILKDRFIRYRNDRYLY
ncbi:ZYRO0B09020p [Zygosaccharomyces rouxii]|uniref:ZYRO0B09020p n=1 Tax=Zygosaccharomyces rouxii (strain ATCC 2623 / CBS 732 / NBRC 1130 / NCYC 568 / NRRL Y-229) TaxID=559307 RepID=C5DRJ9_ZYGRC|nr:uncharacterized protein ZYRO0B09020g [Zygosaccharomyces rouxii]KAH9200054.1 hypothetical protein LQ764DRAFT_112013 [Zygosaccharomyces rouxii]CAR26410.1 ZYRO0B09020p [Zygosaccharomyces rouxii]